MNQSIMIVDTPDCCENCLCLGGFARAYAMCRARGGDYQEPLQQTGVVSTYTNTGKGEIKMKKITKTVSAGTKLNKWCNMYEKCEDCTMGPTFCEHLRDGIEKFASYKDAEEQGLLVKLPCKIGDAIYRMTPETLAPITRDIIMQITICDGFILLHGEVISEIDAAEIGETAFLSEEEAYQKLKELTK